jgi:hypothetical protein
LNNNPAAKTYQQAMEPARDHVLDQRRQGGLRAVKGRGAEFTMPKTDVTCTTIAMLKDNCGNLVQLTQLARW